jgi:hypothetical protein
MNLNETKKLYSVKEYSEETMKTQERRDNPVEHFRSDWSPCPILLHARLMPIARRLFDTEIRSQQ